jgi:hypothetical protein
VQADTPQEEPHVSTTPPSDAHDHAPATLDPQPPGELSTGLRIGIGLAAVGILVIGLAGPLVGFAAGASAGVDARTDGSSRPCLPVLCSDADDIGVVDAAADPVAPTGDFPLSKTVESTSVPLLGAAVPDGWTEEKADDPNQRLFREPATQCVLLLDGGRSVPAGTESDAAVTGAVVDGFVGALKADGRYSSLVAHDAKPTWVDYDAGEGRIALQTQQVDETFASSGAQWRAWFAARSFSRSGVVVYALYECPVAVDADPAAGFRPLSIDFG